ncbi:MAG: F0F1 ATP synthase subunit delta [Rhodospirillales bacterium]|nr:F0F1 ATP synthase subunit delta [Rhodospirillales bacterium]
MSSSSQASSVVSQRYARALIELAEESKKLDKVEKDLQDLKAMIESSDDLQTAIRSPLYSEQSLLNVVGALADKAKFQDITKNFLGLLVKNGRLGGLQKILDAFAGALDKRRGAIAVNVEVAQDLSAGQQKDLETALSKAIGKDVAVSASVKPDLLGGMVVTVGSLMIDDSVRRKLERLKVSMGSGANENTVSNLSEVS